MFYHLPKYSKISKYDLSQKVRRYVLIRYILIIPYPSAQEEENYKQIIAKGDKLLKKY